MRNMPFEETFLRDEYPPSEQQLLLWLSGRLRERFPSSWSVRVITEQVSTAMGVDALLLISDLNGQSKQVAIEVDGGLRLVTSSLE